LIKKREAVKKRKRVIDSNSDNSDDNESDGFNIDDYNEKDSDDKSSGEKDFVDCNLNCLM
jgi:hypothetical protein